MGCDKGLLLNAPRPSAVRRSRYACTVLQAIAIGPGRGRHARDASAALPPDPTAADGRLATWWRAIRDHDVCRRAADDYDTALEEFLERLDRILAQRDKAS